MKTLDEVRRQLAQGEFELSRHALKRAVERNISASEICQAGTHATLIEDYPDDKYVLSCLLLGFTQADRPLHMQISLTETMGVRIITLYDPNTIEWTDYRYRRL